jgi:hypothetical protein
MIMHIALNVNVQVKDGTLVLTDRAGKTVTFSKEQTVQKKVSMIALGELCGLPKRQLATGFGFKTRTSYYDSRNAVLTGTPEDLLPKRTGPHTRSKRTKEVEALIIRTRFETDGTMYEIADALTELGFPISARLVGRVLAAYGLSKKTRVAKLAGGSPPPASRDTRRDPGESADEGSAADGGSPVPAAVLARH